MNKSKIVVPVLPLLLLFFLSLHGCASHEQKKESVTEISHNDASFPLTLPASFSGETTGDGCQRVEIDLNLRPDNLYQMRTTCFNADNAVKSQESQMRRWGYVVDEKVLILGVDKEKLNKYSVLSDGGVLRLLESAEEQTPKQYDLVLEKAYDQFSDIVQIQGMYQSSENTHTLQECSSGEVFQVDPSDGFMKLDFAYKTTTHEKDEPLLVTIQGSLLPTTHGKIGKGNEIIVVKRFNRIYPDQDCSGQKVNNTIFGVQWTAVEIGGELVVLEEGEKAPFFTLSQEYNSIRGFSGCNKIGGNFVFQGIVFLFNKVFSTRMACRQGMELENRFLDNLDQTETYRTEGDNTLLFLDRHGDIVMRLVSESREEEQQR